MEQIAIYEEKIAVAENILRLRKDKRTDKPFVTVKAITPKDEVKLNIELARLQSVLQTTREEYKRYLMFSDKKNAVKSLKKINKLTEDYTKLRASADSA